MSAAEKLGDILGKVREHSDNLKADVKRAGQAIHLLGELADSKQVIASIILFAHNERYSIDDRINQIDKMLVMINSLPHAKPNNWAWDTIYGAYRNLMKFWQMFKSQRYFFAGYKVTEIEELITEKVEKPDGKGGTKTEDISSWESRTVDPATATQLFVDQGEQETIHILRNLDKGLPTSEYSDMAFTKEFSEQCVKDMGEINIIQIQLKIVNVAFNEFNVPVNAILMISSMVNPQGPQTNLTVQAQTEESERGS